MVIPDGVDWELILIDNASDDDTSNVIAEFSQHLPIRSFLESTPGHCAARNRAVQELKGNLVLWTDDDVEVDTQWLNSYVNVALRDDKFAFWGGPIKAKFESETPPWITENWDILSGCYAVRDLGDKPVELNKDLLPYGANFAVRAEIQKQYRFDTNVGRNRQQVVGGDEIDVMRRMLTDGYSGRWVPNAKLLHVIPDDRATEEYVYQYFVGQGKLLGTDDSFFARFKNRVAAVWYQFLYHRNRNKAPSRRWLSHKINQALAVGKIKR